MGYWVRYDMASNPLFGGMTICGWVWGVGVQESAIGVLLEACRLFSRYCGAGWDDTSCQFKISEILISCPLAHPQTQLNFG